MQKGIMAIGKIEYGDAHRPVEITVDITNRRFEFLPERLLLFLRRDGALGGCYSARQEKNNNQATRKFAPNSRSLASLGMIVRQRFRGWNAIDSIFTTVVSSHSLHI